MATTPPLQIASTPDTPPTPLHGAAYDRQHPRRSTRSSVRIASQKVCATPDALQRTPRGQVSMTTPGSSTHFPSRVLPGIHSPQLTPKNKGSRRVQVISPPSPSTQTSIPKPQPPSKSHLQPFPSSTTTISEGMLPTPVKTPKKKMVPSVNAAARALFQDPVQTATNSMKFEPSPRKSRKNKRYNGFSLESFAAEDDGSRGQIQIFTDSRDRVPQADDSKANPFVEQNMNGESSSTCKVRGTSKRRKVSGEKKLDPQVEEAIRDDEGMVYVFRGKKVFRRFDDDDDEEEEIDAGDLGLLEHNPKDSGGKPLKTLTRRSIKPTRLFQTEEQKRAREAEKEEEALTDIEDPTGPSGDILGEMRESKESETVPMPKSGRSLRSAMKGEGGANERSRHSSKKVSPFDSWPRLKSTGRSEGGSSKGRKRGAAEAVEDNVEIGSPEKTRT